MISRLLLFLVLLLPWSFGCGRDASEGGRLSARARPQNQLELSPFETVAGTQYVRAAMREPAKRGLLSGYGEYAEAQNFLFYDLQSGTSRWLLPGDRARLVEAFPLAWPPRQADPTSSLRNSGPVRAFVYTVRERDTNGDGDLGRGDEALIAVSGPDGSGYRILVPTTTRFLGAFSIDEGRARVLYLRDGAVHGMEIDVARGETIREVNAPGIPPA